MPYIKKSEREWLNPVLDELQRCIELDVDTFEFTPGQLNYLITKMAEMYVAVNGQSYDTLNAVMGVLSCASEEVYRRKVTPYEERKIIENGDI